MSKMDKKKLNAEITNAVMEDVGAFEFLMMRHWKTLVAILIALVVLLGIVLGVNSARKSQLKKSAEALTAAKTEKELVDALNLYGDAPAAIHARLRLARIYANEKKFEDALKEFRKIEQSGAPQDLVGRIRLNEGYMLENSGKLKEAADLLAGIGMNTAMPAEIRAEANFGAGRLMTKDSRLTEAVAKFSIAVALQPEVDQMNAGWCQMSQFMIAQIEKGLFGKYTPAAQAPAAK